ncbi:NAD(P)-binding protein, partial [Metschnikowia bicuspidata var. bicuspidata NRRL YB-4993]
MWFSKSHFKPEGKTALVVGASQGVGADLGLRLFEKGCSVVLVARTEAKLKQQVARILDENKKAQKALRPKAKEPTVSYQVCDVADYEACEHMWHELLVEKHVDPDFIFCCAGLSIPKLFGDLTGRELASGMSTNYLTAVNTIHAGHKSILQMNVDADPAGFKPRHVVLFSSTVASFPFIGYGQYAPCKAALMSLSVILRQELVSYNYRVSCVFPGNFESEGYAEEQKTKPEITRKIEGPSVAIPSMECCDIVLDRLAKGYDSIYTDFIGWVLASSALGVMPRCWGFLQILVSLIFLVIAPIANMFIYLDIKASFK